MKKILSALLVLTLCLTMAVPAMAAGAFNPSLDIDRSNPNQIAVTVQDGTILSQKPTLSVPCDFQQAYVTLNGVVIASTLTGGNISFAVEQGGTYLIIDGTAPAPAPNPSPTVPTTPGNGNTVAPTTTVQNGVATAVVGAADLSNVIAQATQNGGDVVIEPQVSGSASTVATEIPLTSANAIVSQTNSNLTVKTDFADVSITSAALKNLVDKTSSEITISVSEVKPQSVATQVPAAMQPDVVVAEVKVLVDGKPVTSFGGANLVLTFPATKAHRPGQMYKVIAIHDDGTQTQMIGVCVGDQIRVVTNHLTTFVVTTESAKSFADVAEKAYYGDAVLWAAANGITSGVSEDRFAPEAVCTRGQVVTFLWRAAGCPRASGKNPFIDVKEASYCYDAVLWAVEKGITSGVSADRFVPDAQVTRAQFVTFLYRYAGSPAVKTEAAFRDVAGSAYYASAVSWAASEGITSGTGTTTFSPAAGCTRGQTVTFLYRYLGK